MNKSLTKASAKASAKAANASAKAANASEKAPNATDKPFRRRGSSVKKEFTEKELKELKTAFELLDSNQDGRVSTEELKHMLGKLGVDVDDNVLQGLVQTASAAGNEIIDETEFLVWVKKIQELCPEAPTSPSKTTKTTTSASSVKSDEDMEEEHKTLSAAFKVFDLDGNGYITRDELKIGMETIGEPVTEEQITEFINMADTDKDGRINYEEFSRLLL